MKKNFKVILLAVVMALSIVVLTACNIDFNNLKGEIEGFISDIFTDEKTTTSTPSNVNVEGNFKASDIPAFTGEAYVSINGSIPFFTDDEKNTKVFETYSPLDSLGRCGVAYANICKELMPTEERGAIGSVKPSGWSQVKYSFVDGQYLYNRCHLIGFQLAGENANPLNLITGTRYLNIEGMLPFENLVDDYVDETKNHVLYRVTPIYEGNDLVCRGVLMEGFSVEDDGEGVCFCVFAYNVQPGVKINYADGSSTLDGTKTEITEISFLFFEVTKEYIY
jgi:DNA-entry nuclease